VSLVFNELFIIFEMSEVLKVPAIVKIKKKSTRALDFTIHPLTSLCEFVQ